MAHTYLSSNDQHAAAATGPVRSPLNNIHFGGVLAIFVVPFILTVITASECHQAVSQDHPGLSPIPPILYASIFWLWWGGVTAGLWWCARRWPSFVSFYAPRFLLHVGIGSLLAVAHLEVLNLTLGFTGRYWPDWGTTPGPLFNAQTLNRFGIELLIYGFLYGISGLLVMQFLAQREALRQLELEKQLSQAQLKALQMQMEPHFLFNTLNAVTTLVELGRNHEASETLAHLNTILRMTLQRNSPDKVPFAEELRVIESYLAIQQVRFADRLQVRIETTPEALEGLVPCFLLQPIVENAIRHGIAPMETGGVIETSVRRVGDKLCMRVKDNGNGDKSIAAKGHGIGIRNTRERLAYFYPEYEFAAIAPAGGGYEVTIQIPYERSVP